MKLMKFFWRRNSNGFGTAKRFLFFILYLENTLLSCTPDSARLRSLAASAAVRVFLKVALKTASSAVRVEEAFTAATAFDRRAASRYRNRLLCRVTKASGSFLRGPVFIIR